MNNIICADCLEVLQQHPASVFDMVYLDPPFFTQKSHALTTRDLQTTYVFEDKWQSLQDYLTFLKLRLVEIRRVMNDTATLFFHCDRQASHHIRFLLDEIFGTQQFQSEIIWTYRRWSNERRGLLNSHQTIFMYSKTPEFKFNVLAQNYSETTNLDQILQKRQRTAAGKTVYAENETGEIILNGAKKGVPLSDTWDIPYLNPKARERTGYPTQKPLLLLERVIQISTDADDYVLDPFCGSGTTIVAASLLNRRFMGIDISAPAVELAQIRLDKPVKTHSHLLIKGREGYDSLPDYVKHILASMPVKLVQRNAGIDAIYDEFIEERPVLFRVQRYEETLQEAAAKLQTAGRRKKASRLILIQTHHTNRRMLLPVENEIPSEIAVIPAPALMLEGLLIPFRDS